MTHEYEIDPESLNATGNSTTKQIEIILASLCNLLEYKNNKYGDSAISPEKIFYKGSPEDAILVRLNDKIGRVKNSDGLRKNDIADLMGYLTLLCVIKGWNDFSEFED